MVTCRQVTRDGVWTVFVGRNLCFSDLTLEQADALEALFA